MSGNPNFIQRTECPGCRSTHVQLLREARYDAAPLHEYLDEFYRAVGRVDHTELAGAMYCLQACDACGLVFQRDIPDGRLSAKLYEQWMDPQKVFDVYERGHGVNFYSPLARQVETFIRHFGRKPGDLKVLDLGMGWGRWCMFANAFGCETYGLEISPARISYARANGVRILDYADLPNHEFDMINAEQVFEHLPEPLDTLAMLRPRLREGGLIWIAVPNGTDIRRRIARWDWTAPKDAPDSLNAVAPLEHLNCFTPEALAAMAAKAGFRPAELRLPARKQQTPWWRRAMGGRAAAKKPAGTERYFTPVHLAS